VEFVSIRDFKTHATKLMKTGKPLVIFRNSKPAGMFIPWEDLQTNKLDDELRQMAFLAITEKIAQERKQQEVTEEEILDDFREFSKNRRGRKRDSIGPDRG